MDYEPPLPTRNQKKYNELQRLTEMEDRLFKRLTRTMNALAKVRDQKRRLQKPPKDKIEKPLKITGEEWTKIREKDFDDTVPVF